MRRLLWSRKTVLTQLPEKIAYSKILNQNFVPDLLDTFYLVQEFYRSYLCPKFEKFEKLQLKVQKNPVSYSLFSLLSLNNPSDRKQFWDSCRTFFVNSPTLLPKTFEFPKKSSCGHLECSFDNPAKKFRPKLLRVFAKSPDRSLRVIICFQNVLFKQFFGAHWMQFWQPLQKFLVESPRKWQTCIFYSKTLPPPQKWSSGVVGLTFQNTTQTFFAQSAKDVWRFSRKLFDWERPLRPFLGKLVRQPIFSFKALVNFYDFRFLKKIAEHIRLKISFERTSFRQKLYLLSKKWVSP